MFLLEYRHDDISILECLKGSNLALDSAFLLRYIQLIEWRETVADLPKLAEHLDPISSGCVGSR